MSLQRQVEQYQLKEKTAEMIESSASFDKMMSLTIIATLLFNSVVGVESKSFVEILIDDVLRGDFF
jgi:hypothetical protein